jgi:hypothetical protein
LHRQGKFGGPGMGQGRKPKRRLDLSASTCPHCGGSLEDMQPTAKVRTETKSGGNVGRSFGTRRAADGTLEIVYLDAGFDDVALSEAGETLRKGQSVNVAGRRGVITGFSRDRDHVYVRFGDSARKVSVDEVTPVR